MRLLLIPDDVEGYLALRVEVGLLVVLADELVVVDGLEVEDVLLGALQLVGLLQRRVHSLELGGVEDVAGRQQLGPPAKLDLRKDRVKLINDLRGDMLGEYLNVLVGCTSLQHI